MIIMGSSSPLIKLTRQQKTTNPIHPIQTKPKPNARPYTDLPQLVPQKLLAQHFGAPLDDEGVERMLSVSAFYSKGRKGTSKAGVFSGDSAKKENAASDKVKKAAQRYLYPIYEQCMAASKEHDRVHPPLTV